MILKNPTDGARQAARRSETVDRKQQLRLQRLWISVAVYLPCALLLYVVGWLGYLPAWFTPAWTAVFACANLVFYALIKTNGNLRFKDPSMTMAQMSVAIGAVSLILYHVEGARGALMMFLLVIVFFGMFQLTTMEVLAMGGLSSIAYALIIALLAVNRPERVNLSLEWVQWIALTATLAVLCPLVGYVSNVRRRLSESLRTIRDMANRDALTGAYNRHHLEETLERDIARCERGGPPFLLLMLDIDHFKTINDTHGHLAGDEALRAIALGVSSVLRKADYLARYGGEEFVVVLSHYNGAVPHASCERIREHVQSLQVAPLGATRLSVSIGASLCQRTDTVSSILSRADTALYRAKRNGRNRVELDIALTDSETATHQGAGERGQRIAHPESATASPTH